MKSSTIIKIGNVEFLKYHYLGTAFIIWRTVMLCQSLHHTAFIKPTIAVIFAHDFSFGKFK